MKKSIAIAAFLLFANLQSASAQVPESSKLFTDVMALDSQLFDEGFNQCKPYVFEKLVDDKL